MGIIDWLVAWWHLGRRRRLQGLAELLAMESRSAVWSRLQTRVGQLGSVPEAAGYIRVRARELVCSELSGAAPQCPWLSHRQKQQVLDLALAILVDQFTRPMLRVPVTIVALRRAA